MSKDWITTKTELLNHIERDWSALNKFLDNLSENLWTDIKNADDWTIKDHVAHMSAWENSVIAFLTGTDRHKGLGISEPLYTEEGIDAINAAIFKKHQNDSLDDVKSQFQQTHRDLMSLVNKLDDEGLKRPYSYYLPDEEGEGEGPPAINIIYGNTAHHYREHQGWMQAMLQAD